jgi:hypothetical protein
VSITEATRPTKLPAAPKHETSAGSSGSFSGRTGSGTQRGFAAEGPSSPQATVEAASKLDSPAGNNASRSQSTAETQNTLAATGSRPGGQRESGAQMFPAAGDPLLALAADVLGDLEKVRIANENRLRQLTRSVEDSDGGTRGFGLDEAHPDVARLAALVGMLTDAEHKATLNLQRFMRKHPLGPWMAAQKGIGEKQGARLLAAIGDPYFRPEITREDGTVEPSRPRMVSELWAYCGYHVIPADHPTTVPQRRNVGGELNGSDPGAHSVAADARLAGVAPKRQRGTRANWSAVAKMRAFLVAESCIKQSGTSHRAVYDATRAKYADAVHAVDCVRCGPKNDPALPGSPLSDGHKHARALRAVAKEILRDLWREAKRVHEETSAGCQRIADAHSGLAASGNGQTSEVAA